MEIAWAIKTFDELSNHDLYALLRLRSEVFVLEQQCIFMDMDDKDQYCHHLLGWRDGTLLAVARILPPGLSYESASIGRIAVASVARGTGSGHELVSRSIQCVENVYGKQTIKIGAQCYLKKFYEIFGFEQTGPEYLEDGIKHVEMKRI